MRVELADHQAAARSLTPQPCLGFVEQPPTVFRQAIYHCHHGGQGLLASRHRQRDKGVQLLSQSLDQILRGVVSPQDEGLRA
ncbi:hypothetical protein GCM10027028_12620 [Streptomyces sundarbansensis]